MRAMPNLHTLVFSRSLRRGCGPECCAAEKEFWAAVTGTHGSLRRLEYAQPPRDVPPPPTRSTTELFTSRTLCLSVKHAEFLRHPPSVVQFSRVFSRGTVSSPSQLMLPNTPGCWSLSLAVQYPSFDLHALLHDMHFPHLQSLALDILAPEAPSNTCAFAMLLERTPTLQYAAWRHLDPDALSAGALPALCTLHTEEVPASPGAAGRALLQGGAALDALGSMCLDAAALEALAQMRGEALRRLEVASFESIAVLVRAVRLFPRLRWLRMPAVDYWHEHTPITPAPVQLGEWVGVLAALPELEVFRGVSIFRDPESTTIEENDKRACDIVNLCPRLRQVEHWDLDPAHAIALAWEGDRVVWRVEEVSGVDRNSVWGR